MKTQHHYVGMVGRNYDNDQSWPAQNQADESLKWNSEDWIGNIGVFNNVLVYFVIKSRVGE